MHHVLVLELVREGDTQIAKTLREILERRGRLAFLVFVFHIGDETDFFGRRPVNYGLAVVDPEVLLLQYRTSSE